MIIELERHIWDNAIYGTVKECPIYGVHTVVPEMSPSFHMQFKVELGVGIYGEQASSNVFSDFYMQP
jgi:hypothetical protein